MFIFRVLLDDDTKTLHINIKVLRVISILIDMHKLNMHATVCSSCISHVQHLSPDYYDIVIILMHQDKLIRKSVSFCCSKKGDLITIFSRTSKSFLRIL